MNPKTPTGFSRTTRALHWFIGFSMIGLIALGWWMVDLTYYSQWYNTGPWIHKALGVLVFLAGLALLANRMWRDPVAHVAGHKPWEISLSKIAHVVLITAIITIPISGYVFTTATGDGIDMFGAFTIPALFTVGEGVRDLAIAFHYYASYGLVAIIVLHIAGALKHHFVDRDATLKRMIAP